MKAIDDASSYHVYQKENCCIFCGEEVSLLTRRKLSCANVEQTVCRACYAKYAELSAEERGRAALATGNAESADEIQEYLKQRQEVRDRKEEAMEAERKRRMSDKLCLRCQVPMIAYGPYALAVGSDMGIGIGVTIGTGSAHAHPGNVYGEIRVKALRCPSCGMTEFYTENEEDLVREEE